ncbi:hypothetical protein QJS10_CPA05g00569 [Acorus calamus]|uniref:H(+)-exporting diphosphatase n=1 Tax=Acorus calamus TaxID=4465 RepID=A0AAV9EVD0_ACOCL|nr:hypothetical protein QJS10_CPA05g00569 [Acorus calamus]
MRWTRISNGLNGPCFKVCKTQKYTLHSDQLLSPVPSTSNQRFTKETLPGYKGASDHARSLGPKGFDPQKVAVIGDTIGDSLTDTCGPSLNILIKLMAVESLMFVSRLGENKGLLFEDDEKGVDNMDEDDEFFN